MLSELLFLKYPWAMATGILPVLLLEKGLTKYDIGIVNLLMTIASLLAGIYYAKREQEIKSLPFFYFIAFIAVLSLALIDSRDLLFLAAFILAFYYSGALLLVQLMAAREKEKIREMQVKFQLWGGLFYLLGLFLGTVLSKFMPLEEVYIFAAFSFLLGIAAIGKRGVKEEVVRRIREEGILGAIEDFSRQTERGITASILDLREIKISRRLLLFYISVLLFFFGATLGISQITVYFKEVGMDNYKIYLLSLISSAAALAGYQLAKYISERWIFAATVIQIIPFLLFMTGKEHLFYAGCFVDGLQWGIYQVLIDSYVLKKAKEEFGAYKAICSIGTAAASYIAGILLMIFPFKTIFVMSSIIIGIGTVFAIVGV